MQQNCLFSDDFGSRFTTAPRLFSETNFYDEKHLLYLDIVAHVCMHLPVFTENKKYSLVGGGKEFLEPPPVLKKGKKKEPAECASTPRSMWTRLFSS